MAFWWDKENKSDEVMRLLIQKTGELGHLPTPEEVRADPRMPSGMDIVSNYESFDKAIEEVAGHLYGHPYRKSPEDLVPAQRNLSPEAQEKAKQAQRLHYEEQLKLLSKPGGLQEMRKKQQEARRFRYSTPADKITRLPMATRQNRLAEREAAKQITLPPREQPVPKPAPKPVPRPTPKPAPVSRPRPAPQVTRPVPPRPAPSVAPKTETTKSRPMPKPESKPAPPVVPTVAPPVVTSSVPIQKEVPKMPRDKSTRYTQGDLRNTAQQLEDHFGSKLPSQQEIKQYLEKHHDLASYRTMVLRWGPKSQWLAILHGEAELPAHGKVPAPAPEDADVSAPPMPTEAESDAPTGVQPATPSDTGVTAAADSKPAAPPAVAPEEASAVPPVESDGQTPPAPESVTSAEMNPTPAPQPSPSEDQNNQDAPGDDEQGKTDEPSQPQTQSDTPPVGEISIPLPGIAGKLKLEVELDERSLTLRIVFR